MVSLARAMLWYEWRRFLPAGCAVAFAGLLVLIQLALLLGLFSTVSVYIDQSSADLWVGFPKSESIDIARNIPSQSEVFLRMHPDVVRVDHFNWSLGDWRRASGAPVSCALVGVDTDARSLTFSRLLTPRHRRLLDEPGAVLIDQSDMSKLGATIGGWAEINGRRVKVVGTVDGMRSIGSANVIMSRATNRLIDPAMRKGDMSAWLLVQLRDASRAEEVRRALTPSGSLQPYRIWTSSELSTQSQLYWLLESGSGVGFLFSSALGLIVGIVIASQTLMATVVSALREYAVLRALGVSFVRLGRVVIEQACWVGLFGVMTTLAITAVLVKVAEAGNVALVVPAWGLAVTSAALLLVAVVSGLSALNALRQSDPAILLR